jgi:endonuclease YncB( thermonuclease family)
MKKIPPLAMALLALTILVWPLPGAAEAEGQTVRLGPAPAEDTDSHRPRGRPRPNQPPNHHQRKPRKPTVIIRVPTQVQTYSRTQTTKITGPITITQEFPAAVLKVPDGDTIIVRTDNYKDIEVRLYGIDCPEWNQPGGAEASVFMRSLQGRQVTVREMDTDIYGRMVALIEFEGRSVNLDLAARGHAWYYAYHCQSQPICGQLQAAEAEARTARRGLWAGQSPVAPWEWRRRR